MSKSVNFYTPYLTEKLKLGDPDALAAIRKQPELADLSAREVGLTLSFSEDRALAAVQSLFSFGSFEPHSAAPLTPQGQAWWGCDELPVLVLEAGDYVRAYAQGAGTTAEVAMAALRSLAQRCFYLAYTEHDKGPYRVVHAPVLAAQKYKLQGTRQPTHLRVALTPALYQGVYPECRGYRAKPKNLHARLIELSGSKPGRPPETLLRLASWVLTLTAPSTPVTERKLAEKLRTRTLTNSQPGKFREDLRRSFGILKAAGILEDFIPPGLEDKGKWHVKLAAGQFRSRA